MEAYDRYSSAIHEYVKDDEKMFPITEKDH